MRRLGRALEIAGWLLITAIPVTLFAPGCQGRECESDGYKDYGYGPGEGHLVDANTWETTANGATWIAFGPYHTWGLHPVGLEGRDLVSITPYISADPNPNAPGNNYAIAAGNLAEIEVSADSRNVFINNSTCSPLYLRVVIVADPAQPNPFSGGDGGPDEGGTIDLDAGDGGD